jgi:hypothetical protein
MRKQQEIELLDTLIQQTPRNSYLRSMLEHLRPQFESDIRSDFSTLPDVAALEREGLALTERNRQLHRLNADVEKQIRDQRQQQGYLYSRIKTLKDEVVQAGTMLETTLKNFTKE